MDNSGLKAGDNMALKKTITDTKGITTEYHMIDSLKVMCDRIEVTLKSYTAESYRLLEKEIEDNKVLQEELQQQILDEYNKAEPDLELINSLNEQITSLKIVSKDYSVGSFKYRIPFSKEDSLSYTDIYEQLKTESTFADAEDC